MQFNFFRFVRFNSPGINRWGAGGSNKQGGGKLHKIKWAGGRKFMVAVQQPHKYKTPRLVSLEGNTFQNFAT